MSMKKYLLELYSDYFLISFAYTTESGLSDLPDKQIVQKRWAGKRVDRTPVTAAGLTDHVWSLWEWITNFCPLQNRMEECKN